MKRVLLSYKKFFERYINLVAVFYVIMALALFFIPFLFYRLQPQSTTSLSLFSGLVGQARVLAEFGYAFEPHDVARITRNIVFISLVLTFSLAISVVVAVRIAKKGVRKTSYLPLPFLPYLIYFVAQYSKALPHVGETQLVTFHIGFYLSIILTLPPIIYLIASKLNYDNLPKPKQVKPRKPTKAERIAALEEEIRRLSSK